MTTPVVNYIPTFYLSTGLPASGYWLKAYEAGAVSTAVTTYTTKADVTGGTKFQLNSLGQPASGGTAFAPHYSETVDAWIFPTSAEADANDTSNAIQVIDASVVNPFAVLNETIQKVGSSVGSAADVITAALTVNPGSLADPLMVRVELAHGANTVTNPTFNLNSLGAKTIKKLNNAALAVGDTMGSGAVLDLVYSETNDVWLLLNPLKKSTTKTLYTASNTHTTSTGCTRIEFEVHAAGGGGGGTASVSSSVANAAGGGSGGIVYDSTSTVASSYTITVGTGGAGGAAGNNNGAAGGNSVVTDGASYTLTATGGGGGGGAASGGSGSASTAGDGSGSDQVIAGNAGGASTSVGGTTLYSKVTAVTINVDAADAVSLSAGGNGARANGTVGALAGGDGYDGLVVVTEYF